MTEEKFSKPKVNSASQKELDKCEEQFKDFDASVQKMTLDSMNKAPFEECEQQTKMSSREQQKSKDFYLKPKKSIYPVNSKTGESPKFNERFRSEYEFAKEYVQFIAENKEIMGEDLDLWTLPFPGMPAEQWIVPTNKPVWGPRYLAEQIKRKFYHRIVMQESRSSNLISGGGMGEFYGSLAADTTVKRLDAYPVSQSRSVFMNSSGF